MIFDRKKQLNWLVGLGQEGFAWGWGNCLKYLKRGWNRKEGRKNKDFEKGRASQGIIQGFNLGVGSHVNITLRCKLCSWGVDGGAVRPCCKLPHHVLLYITSRFAYMKHLFVDNLFWFFCSELQLQCSYSVL